MNFSVVALGLHCLSRLFGRQLVVQNFKTFTIHNWLSKYFISCLKLNTISPVWPVIKCKELHRKIHPNFLKYPCCSRIILRGTTFFCFIWLCPSQQFFSHVTSGCVFRGWTSTKQRIKSLAQGPTQWFCRRWGWDDYWQEHAIFGIYHLWVKSFFFTLLLRNKKLIFLLHTLYIY